jgi:hypothetical protein
MLSLCMYSTVSIRAWEVSMLCAGLGAVPLASILYRGSNASESAKWVAVVMLMLCGGFILYVLTY